MKITCTKRAALLASLVCLPAMAQTALNDTGISQQQCYDAGSNLLGDCKTSSLGGPRPDHRADLGGENRHRAAGRQSGLCQLHPPTFDPNGQFGAPTDATGFINAANAAGLCGASDWRLPTVHEAQILAHYGGMAFAGGDGGLIAIDTNWFPNTVEAFKDNLAHVVWRRCLEGQTYGFGQCSGPTSTFTHEAALQHAAAVALATGQDWRVPNVKELGSVVNHTASQPAIDSVFPNVPNLKSWTSTPMRFSGGTSSAWHVDFFQGYVAGQSRLASNNIRLLRSLP